MKIIANELNSYKLNAKKLRDIFNYTIHQSGEINYLDLGNELFLLSYTPDHGQFGEIIIYESVQGIVLFQFNDDFFSPILMHKISNEQILIISNSPVFGHGVFENVYVLNASKLELKELKKGIREDPKSFSHSLSLFPYANSEYLIDLKRLQYLIL